MTAGMSSDREPSARRYRRFFGAEPTRDAGDELAFHLAMRIDEFKRAGLNEQQAEEAAIQPFCSVSHWRWTEQKGSGDWLVIPTESMAWTTSPERHWPQIHFIE